MPRQLTGLFKRIQAFLIGTNPIEVYGGNKGGYSYIIFYDPKNREVLHQYVTPPKQQSRNIGVGVTAANAAVSGNVNYQSEETFGDTFAVTNQDANLKFDTTTLLTKFNETQQTNPLSQPNTTYNLQGDEKFLAGAYVVPVSSKDVECPNFESHFPRPDPRVDDQLAMFPEFILQAFRPDDKNFRSSIFLHDAITRELKIHASFNMNAAIDLTLALPDTAGTVGLACQQRKPIIWDGAVISHQERGIDPSKIWPEMQSILAVPILDSNNIPLGAISIDSNKRYVDAGFDDRNLNKSLMILSRSIGKLLEKSVR